MLNFICLCFDNLVFLVLYRYILWLWFLCGWFVLLFVCIVFFDGWIFFLKSFSFDNFCMIFLLIFLIGEVCIFWKFNKGWLFFLLWVFWLKKLLVFEIILYCWLFFVLEWLFVRFVFFFFCLVYCFMLWLVNMY